MQEMKFVMLSDRNERNKKNLSCYNLDYKRTLERLPLPRLHQLRKHALERERANISYGNLIK